MRQREVPFKDHTELVSKPLRWRLDSRVLLGVRLSCTFQTTLIVFKFQLLLLTMFKVMNKRIEKPADRCAEYSLEFTPN